MSGNQSRVSIHGYDEIESRASRTTWLGLQWEIGMTMDLFSGVAAFSITYRSFQTSEQ